MDLYIQNWTRDIWVRVFGEREMWNVLKVYIDFYMCKHACCCCSLIQAKEHGKSYGDFFFPAQITIACNGIWI